MPRYDFLCPSGHRFEEICSAGTEIVACLECHTPAKRQFTVARPDQFRHWPERFAVTRGQVGERFVRKQWKGVDLP